MTRRAHGFSLIELLVAVAVFAVASALAWAGLSAVSQTRQRLADEQRQFATIQLSVASLSRDLVTAVVRPVRADNGAALPALMGDDRRIELTRKGIASVLETHAAALERVSWFVDDKALTRARYQVLDRAADSRPVLRKLDTEVDGFDLRYLDHQGRWQSRWPAPGNADPAPLPRAIEFRVRFHELGEVRRVIELPVSQPVQAQPIGAGE